MKFRLTIEVEYTGRPTVEAKASVIQTLRYAAEHLAGNGLLSEGTGREVKDWTTTVQEAKEGKK
jgi:hypothetical protein